MEAYLGIFVGIGLSATCGFRVFVPLLGMSIASATGHMSLSKDFHWLSSPLAITIFSIATVLEIVTYYVPWLDNVMDTISSPASVVAGTIISASMVTDVSPVLQWTLAVIAGGGSAGIVQGGTVFLRGALTATTGGIGNFMWSTIELVMAVLTTLLALVMPVVAAIFAICLCLWILRKLMRAFSRDKAVINGEISGRGHEYGEI